MFKPRFKVSPKLNNLLVKIAVDADKIVNLGILPKRELGLMRSARLRMIHSSTAIEGNPLGIRDVEAVLAGKVVTGINQKDRLEVVNYEKAMQYIDKIVKGNIADWEKVVLEIHRLTTKDLLASKESGCYRIGPVFIVQRPSNKVLYRAPLASKVKKLMKEFYSWLKSKEAGELSPVIVAAVAHHQLVTIHPFIDGNGRTARILATLVLYDRGYDIKKTFALEDYYNLKRQAYYKAIQKARKRNDLTSWLEYFSQGFLVELNNVLEKVDHFAVEMKTKKEPIYLSKRQRDILDFVAINGKIFRSDVVDIVTVSPKTAYRELEFLRQNDLLLRKGRGPSSHYILKKG